MTTNRVTLCAAATLLLSGCATIFRSTDARVWLTSQPPGAAVTVDGQEVGVTPTQVNVTRKQPHLVSFVRDSMRVDTVLKRHPEPWLLAYLLLSVPGIAFGVVDLVSGAAMTVEDANVVLGPKAFVADATAAPVVAEVPKAIVRPEIDVPLRKNDRLRLAKTDDNEPATYAIVDSVDAEHIYGRTLAAPDAAHADTAVVIAAGDVRRVAHYVRPDRNAGGLGVTRHSVRAMAPFLAFPQGSIVAMLAYPAGYATGFTLAEPQWAPREARRVGSTLLVDDSVSVQFMDYSPLLAGRLVDVDRADLLITSSGGLVRVPRKDVRGIRRSNGRSYFTSAVLGAFAGAFIASTVCRTSRGCPNHRVSSATFSLGAVVAGVLVSPAFAPRRWSEVERW